MLLIWCSTPLHSSVLCTMCYFACILSNLFFPLDFFHLKLWSPDLCMLVHCTATSLFGAPIRKRPPFICPFFSGGRSFSKRFSIINQAECFFRRWKHSLNLLHLLKALSRSLPAPTPTSTMREFPSLHCVACVLGTRTFLTRCHQPGEQNGFSL